MSRVTFVITPCCSSWSSGRPKEGLELSNNSEIVINTSDYRSIRGRTLACVIMDEIAFWPSDGASTDQETYTAAAPGMVTLPYSLLVGITTPYSRRGLAYEKHRRYFGVADDDVLAIQAPSRTLNPTIDQA